MRPVARAGWGAPFERQIAPQGGYTASLTNPKQSFKGAGFLAWCLESSSIGHGVLQQALHFRVQCRVEVEGVDACIPLFGHLGCGRTGSPAIGLGEKMPEVPGASKSGKWSVSCANLAYLSTAQTVMTTSHNLRCRAAMEAS